jgi:hypothetical protein
VAGSPDECTRVDDDFVQDHRQPGPLPDPQALFERSARLFYAQTRHALQHPNVMDCFGQTPTAVRVGDDRIVRVRRADYGAHPSPPRFSALSQCKAVRLRCRLARTRREAPFFPEAAVNMFLYMLGNMVSVAGRNEPIPATNGVIMVRDVALVGLLLAECRPPR